MTASQTEPDLLLGAHGHVRLEGPDGRLLDIVADGATLHLELSGRSDLRGLMPRSLSASRRGVRHASRILTALGLVVSVESGGRPVFQMGAKVRPSLLARIIGFAPARIPLYAIRWLFSS